MALHAAAKGGNIECIRFLLRANVPVDPVNGKGQVILISLSFSLLFFHSLSFFHSLFELIIITDTTSHCL